MKRFIITASDRAVYQEEILANTQEEAMKEFYERMKWAEPVEYDDFKIEFVGIGET